MEKTERQKRSEVMKRYHEAYGDSAYMLEMFGDDLAKRQKYRSGLEGLDAVRYYLMQKHGWLPRDLFSMSHTDLEFAMREETAGWTLPKELRPAAGTKTKKP